MVSSAFHEGERDVQRRAGVETEASRLAGMLSPPQLEGGVAKFLEQRNLAFVTARDSAGRLWISALCGERGFLHGQGSSLTVEAAPQSPDPLHGLKPGQPIGLLTIDLAIRRRVRVNGLLTISRPGLLQIDADQAFGNCPSYIQQRVLEPVAHDRADGGPGAQEIADSVLSAEHERLIRRADTFFLGTTHPQRGADSSHKGGNPGFVRVENGVIWWPDYAGNNLFNSLGNIAVDPDAALLFIDFASGSLLQLSGRAELEWLVPGAAGDDGGTGRRVRFHPQHVRAGTAELRGADVAFSPHNPALAG